MTLSTAQLRMMERITPTGVAEERYEAARGARMAVGPSGLPVPSPRAVFRITADAELLTRITKTALGAHRRLALTEADDATTLAILLADIERRFPAADMAVLERYGAARPFDCLWIEHPGGRGIPVRLPAPMPLPSSGGATNFSLNGDGASAPLPTFARPYFLEVLDIERLRQSYLGVSGVATWARRFKTTEKRAPMWMEIEAAFPVVGAWLTAERRRMKERAQ